MSVQVELVKTGKPYVMFGDGQLASCKPISEADLASFMAECVKDPKKANQLLPIGGKVSLSVLGMQQPAWGLFMDAHFHSDKSGAMQSYVSDGGCGVSPGLQSMDERMCCRSW